MVRTSRTEVTQRGEGKREEGDMRGEREIWEKERERERERDREKKKKKEKKRKRERERERER